MRGRSVWGLREAFGKAAWHWRQLCKAGGEAKAQRTEKEKAWGWGNGGECGRGHSPQDHLPIMAATLGFYTQRRSTPCSRRLRLGCR